MLADIATGHTWGADVAFLLAVIVAVLAVVVEVAERRPRPARSGDGVLRSYPWTNVLGWTAVALLALGFLIL